MNDEPALQYMLEPEERVGIERAFDVIRNYDVHTKGYVMTALKFIEEFGNNDDKAVLQDLLKESTAQFAPPATPKKAVPPAKKEKASRPKSSSKK